MYSGVPFVFHLIHSQVNPNLSSKDVSELLSESPEIENKRRQLNMSMIKIITAIDMIKLY